MSPEEWQEKIRVEYQLSNHHQSQSLTLHNEEQDQSRGLTNQTLKRTTPTC